MKNVYRILIFIWLFVLSIISIISLIRSCQSDVPLGIDYAGILVGILAALCTVLIGWQIFSFIEFTKKEEQNAKKIEELRLTLEKDQQELRQTFEKDLKEIRQNSDYAEFQYHCLIGDLLSQMIHPSPKDALNYSYVFFEILALNEGSYLNETKECNKLIDYLIHFISTHNLMLTPEKKEELLDLLFTVNRDAGLEKLTELIALLSSIEALR